MPDLDDWRRLVARVEAANRPVRIGLVGKYVNLPDAYLSVVEALKHGGFDCGAQVEIDWIASDDTEGLLAEGRLGGLDGIVIPGGFGIRGIEGKIAAAGFAREQEVPFLGLCLGLHCAVIEFARDMCGLAGANSSEFEPHSPHPVIDLMDEQRDVVDKGGTMRLGTYPAKLLPGSVVHAAYGEALVYERHRHRYELNNRYRAKLEEAGMVCSGLSPDDRLVEFIELPDHPFFVGTQAHPEFKSRPDRPHPLFAAFVRAALERAEGRVPRLPIIEATEPLADRRPDGRAVAGSVPAPEGGPAPASEVFRVVERTTLCEAGFLTVERRRVAGPDGDEFDRHVVLHPGAVVVVPVDADGNALLVRQYRVAAGRDLLEVPAGKRDVPGEPPDVTARA